jgi:hypothetical protein
MSIFGNDDLVIAVIAFRTMVAARYRRIQQLPQGN